MGVVKVCGRRASRRHKLLQGSVTIQPRFETRLHPFKNVYIHIHGVIQSVLSKSQQCLISVALRLQV